MSLYTKILTVALLPLIIFFSIGLIQIQATIRNYTSALNRHYELQSASVRKSIDQITSQMATAASVLSKSDEISNALEQADNESLFDFSANFIGAVDSILFSDANGLVIARAPDEYYFGDSIASHTYFVTAMRKGDFFGVEKIDGMPSFAFSKAIKQYDDIAIGMVCIIVQITPELLRSFSDSPDIIIEMAFDDDSVRSSDQKLLVVHQVSIEDAFTAFPRKKLKFNLLFGENRYYADLLNVRKYLYAGSIFAILILSGCLALILNRQLKPYSKIVGLILRHADKEIESDTLRTSLRHLKQTTGEPISKIADSLVKMLDVIEKNFKQIENYNLELKQTNEKLSNEILEREQSERINTTLFAISNAVNISTNLDDLYKRIHFLVGNILDADNFFIAIVNEKEKTLYFPYFVDTVDNDFSPIDNFDPGKSLTGLVVSNRSARLLKEKNLRERADGNGIWGPAPLIWMGTPLMVRDEIIGIIALQSYTDPDLYNEKDLEVLVSISDQMAIAIDRKRTENELIESEKKYRSMMESFVDPLHICSQNFIIEYMNPSMVRRTGRDSTGEKCYRAIHGLESRCAWCVFENVVKGDIISTNIQSPLDGRDYQVTNMPIRNAGGSISQMAIFRDITEYLQALKDKENAQAQLLQAQRMESIGTLAGGIAHDFNNILAAIIGFTELALIDLDTGANIEDSLQEVYAAGKRAKKLVAQILAFARKSMEEIKPIRVDVIVKEVIQFIRSSIPATIDVQSVIGSNSLIMGNQTQVHQVLMNLCTNASQAMENEGGVLTVTLQDMEVNDDFSNPRPDLANGSYVSISVADTGAGIAPDIIESIFDPYFTTKEPGEGTGMGLAMVHGIVESYGGKIFVDSEPGNGATFTIYLPAARKQKLQDQNESESLPTGTERILYIDDEASIVKMSSQGLERLGYQVTTETNSLEALALFKSRPDDFDLVITDMTMPNMTGDKLTLELIKIRPDIPVILCTGYSKKISEETASKMGVTAFAYKPIFKADLAKMVRKTLDAGK